MNLESLSIVDLSTRMDDLAALQPEKPCLQFQTRNGDWDSISFKAIAERTNYFASKLQFHKLSPGLRAALMIPPSTDFFALVFALLKTGIIPVMVDPAIGLRNVTKCFEESLPELFIGNWLTHSLRKVFGWGRKSIRKTLTLDQIIHTPMQIDHYRTNTKPQNNDQPAAIIYTSGSTGLPKGAIYTRENLAAQLGILTETFGINNNEIDLPAFPLFALIDCLIGVTAVIPDMRFPPPAKVDPETIFKAIKLFKVNNIFASPVVLEKLSTYGLQNKESLDHIKRVITAGAPTPINVIANFYQLLPEEGKLYGIYGATESLPMTVIDCKEILTKFRFNTSQGAGICIGKPVENACLRIIEISDTQIKYWEDATEEKAGLTGEITVKGPAVSTSYYGRPDINNLSKIIDGHDIVHRTGDLGYFDPEGRLWYCGRKSHRVPTPYGEFYTEQIEGIFNSHPLVHRTALVGINQQPVLWVELAKHAQKTERDRISRELESIGSEHELSSKVKTFLFMDKFPTDVRHNSKILREKLTRIAQERIR